ncbi:MAG: carbohydrate kinase [Verrucomicrobia bacterium]|nr:carbohydrate kinase [Verrucomicrobiota bacterium]
MPPQRFPALADKYPRLRIAVVGDFCLDRYLDIDPARTETSLETGLPVHNVVHVRSQPGAAGTILNNLAALGVGELCPVGFAGDDGEGFELVRALKAQRGVNMEHFFQTPERRTFTYCKPLVLRPGKPPEELNRLDSKNWTPTPPAVRARLVDSVEFLAAQVDAMILLDQVEKSDTGVITGPLLDAVRTLAKHDPEFLIIADSRRTLRGYPPVMLKMNAAELGILTGARQDLSVDDVKGAARALAQKHGRAVFVTLSEHGMVGALPDGTVEHAPARPPRGPIDIVGAGDAVTANLTAAMAAGATLTESLAIAAAAASVVIHQLGTTGTATVAQLTPLLAAG